MKKELIPVMFVTFINTLNFTILIPVLPFVVKQFGGGSIMYGILLSMYPLFQFFAAPVLGSLSDKYGRRPILLISQAGTFASWLIFLLAYFVPAITVIGALKLPVFIIMLARIVDGITGGNNSVANAYIADCTHQEERTKTFGMLGGIVGIGLIIGPAMGGYAASAGLGFLGPALLAMAVSIIALFMMYFWLPESLTEEHRSKETHVSLFAELKLLDKIRKYTPQARMRYLFFIRTFFLLVFSANGSIMVLYMVDSFHLNEQQIGIFFLMVGCFLILNQMVVARKMAHRFGEMRTFVIGQTAIIVGLAGVICAPTLWWYIPFVYLNNFGFSISFPTYRSLMTRGYEKRQQGELSGIDEAIFAACSAVAPLVTAFLYAHFHVYTFSILASVLAIALAIFVFYYRRYRNATTES